MGRKKSSKLRGVLKQLTFKRFIFDFATKTGAEKYASNRKFKKKGYGVSIKKTKMLAPYKGRYWGYRLTVDKRRKR